MFSKKTPGGALTFAKQQFMSRSTNAVASRARRKKILKLTKGNFLARANVWTVAKNTYEKGLTYAYRDRKVKKRTFRALWIQRINAAVRAYGMTYSEFIGKAAKNNIALNRKVLADLAMNHPKAFEAVVKSLQ
jgi:large subunit ribosomal protein L20